jgi:hypothetical protein
VKHEIHRFSGDGDVEVPCFCFNSGKIYHIGIETAHREQPTEIWIAYDDCRNATRTYGGISDARHMSVHTTLWPDNNKDGDTGKPYYHATIHLAPVKGAWALTINEDLNERGTPDKATSPIFIENPPGEP